MRTQFIYILMTVILLGCTKGQYSPDVEAVLQQAGKNRGQLEKVLKHYSRHPADSLKLRAAEFLIVNMPGKYSRYYDAPWNDVATVFLRWTSSSNKRMVLDTYKIGQPVVREDVKYITAEYLINNIDLSFKVWRERPWGKHIPFDAFCEDILPYRVTTEPLENWREKALASFADLDTVLNKPTTTAVDACCRINSLLPRFKVDKDFPAMNFSQLMASTRGPCDNIASCAIFSMRALGIPVTFESTPKWLDMPAGHSWNAVRDSSGKYISFMGADTNPYQLHQGNKNLKAKVFRKTFARQENIVLSDNRNIPPRLIDINAKKDVSAEYPDCRDTVTVHLRYPPQTVSGYVYLSVYFNHQLHPVAWAKDSAQTAQFPSLGRNIVYFPVYYIDNKQTPAGDPFLIDETGNTTVLSFDSPQMFNAISRSVSGAYLLRRRMYQGIFEGANKADFSDAVVLHIIDRIPEASYNEVRLETPVTCRYIRYKSPPKGFCSVAEIEFYSPSGKKLHGTPVGTPGEQFRNNIIMSCEKAFDDNLQTCFYSLSEDDAWTGLDLHDKKQVHRIRYFPRNHDEPAIVITKDVIMNCFAGHYDIDK
jgi:hypothetical protein